MSLLTLANSCRIRVMLLVLFPCPAHVHTGEIQLIQEDKSELIGLALNLMKCLVIGNPFSNLHKQQCAAESGSNVLITPLHFAIGSSQMLSRSMRLMTHDILPSIAVQQGDIRRCRSVKQDGIAHSIKACWNHAKCRCFSRICKL